MTSYEPVLAAVAELSGAQTRLYAAAAGERVVPLVASLGGDAAHEIIRAALAGLWSGGIDADAAGRLLAAAEATDDYLDDDPNDPGHWSGGALGLLTHVLAGIRDGGPSAETGRLTTLNALNLHKAMGAQLGEEDDAESLEIEPGDVPEAFAVMHAELLALRDGAEVLLRVESAADAAVELRERARTEAARVARLATAMFPRSA